MKKTQGIYGIKNKVNNKMYVGQVNGKKGVEGRFLEHKRLLIKGSHYNKHLQRAWNKYGGDNFEFFILEEVCDIGELDDREQYWINEVWGNCYNMQPTAGGSCLGMKRSDETKIKIGNANKKRVWTTESKLKQSNSQKKRFKEFGTPCSVRERRRQCQLGRKHSKETKERIRLRHLGKVFSEETKNKIRLSHLGKKPSPESISKRKITMAKKPPLEGL